VVFSSVNSTLGNASNKIEINLPEELEDATSNETEGLSNSNLQVGITDRI